MQLAYRWDTAADLEVRLPWKVTCHAVLTLGRTIATGLCPCNRGPVHIRMSESGSYNEANMASAMHASTLQELLEE